MAEFDFAACEKIIGYSFKDKTTLLTAFTHSTFANEHKGEKDNERLEFLGDSLLGFIVAEHYYNDTDGDEGVLTVEKQNVVSNLPLSRAILLCGLEKFLRLGKGEKAQFEASPKESICENLFEALVAAIYLDGGIDSAKKFVREKLFAHFREIAVSRDYKSELQNIVQAVKAGPIEYKVVEKIGPDHSPTFTVHLLVNGVKRGEGKGHSKTEAEKSAARDALSSLNREEK